MYCCKGLCASNLVRQVFNIIEEFNVLLVQNQQPKNDGLSKFLPLKPGEKSCVSEEQIHTHIA